MDFKQIGDSVLINGDCLEVMPLLIEQGVKVDAVIADIPYGTTSCKWDAVIPFDKMWDCLNKLIKEDGAIALFGSEPFSSALRMSNIKNFKYDWIWHKSHGGNFSTVNYQPLKEHEIISIFSGKSGRTVKYYPVKEKRHGSGVETQKYTKRSNVSKSDVFNIKTNIIKKKFDVLRFPCSVQFFNSVSNTNKKRLHPTQKPVALMEYLVKTYTNEEDTVLDFTMGSGTTGVACKNLNRKFIGIELDKGYYDIACKRIEEGK